MRKCENAKKTVKTSSGCHIHNGTYLTLSLTLTRTLTLSNPNRNSKGNPNPTNHTNPLWLNSLFT